MERKLFRNPNEFSLFIEQTAVDEGISCYQALMEYCEEEDIEYEAIAKSINKQLKDKLAVEFADIGMLRKNASLE
jgi:hypothetical protein